MNPRGSDVAGRRAILRTVSGLMAGALISMPLRATQPADNGHGPVKPPRPMPDIPMLRTDDVSVPLPLLMRGHLSAVQLIFTHCSTICPIQAAIFQRVQLLLPDQIMHGTQLVSISIDPSNDTPAALQTWLTRMHAKPGWVGAVPSEKDLPVLQSLFGLGRDALDTHTTQVHIVDRNGCLVWHTYELPPAESIAEILRKG